MDTEKDEQELSPQDSLKLIGKMMDKVQDEALWKIAKKRAAFKLVFIIYLIVNAGCIAIWYFTTGPNSYFWPMWSMLGWGFGIVFQFVDAYMTNGIFSEEKEFEKLKRKARENK